MINQLVAPVKGDLRVWHIPQIPGKAFHVYVGSVQAARKILTTLAQYDRFQFDNNIKGDYANVSGLEVYSGKVYSPDDDGWEEWHDAETYNDIWGQP